MLSGYESAFQDSRLLIPCALTALIRPHSTKRWVTFGLDYLEASLCVGCCTVEVKKRSERERYYSMQTISSTVADPREDERLDWSDGPTG